MIITITVRGVDRNIPGRPQSAPQKARDSSTATGSMFMELPCILGRMTLPTTKLIP